jgi:hypothetical protein
MAGPPGYVVGLLAAIAALDLIGFGFALFASTGGLVFAMMAAFWIGAGVAAVIEPRYAGRNALIVAAVIVGSVVAYLTVASSRPAPPGTSRGGPNVLPP